MRSTSADSLGVSFCWKSLSHKSRTEKNTKYFIGTGNIDLEELIFKEKQITKQKENFAKKKLKAITNCHFAFLTSKKKV